MSQPYAREPESSFVEPDGVADEFGNFRWNSPDEQPGHPGPRMAAFGAIVAAVAVAIGLMAWLAGFELLLWIAVAAVVVAAVMIGMGYRQWRSDVTG
jgi:uncharacterized membrane protein YphA (DoxX/SURF4 family)